MWRTRSVGGLLALLLTCTVTSAHGLDRASANSVWVAETGGAIWLSSSDGSIRVEISGFSHVRAATLDVRREAVWLLGDGELAAFDLTGALRFSLPLKVPRSVHADLVVVPSTGAVWVGANKDLLNVGADGQLLGAFNLEANTVALAVHEEDSLLWVGTERLAEARDLVTGTPVGTIPLEPSQRLGDVRVAPESGRLWIATGDQARLYETTGELVLERRFPGLRRIAPAPGGEAWLASAKAVARLDAGGNLAPAFELLAGKGTIEHLVVSGEGTVWVANQTTIARLPADGSPADRISFRPPARVWDLATNTDWIAPSLDIEAPAEGACLSDKTPSVDLAFTDRGWGVDPATIQLFADGGPIPTSCTTALETATCQVLDPLADGEVLLGARVSDYAGNDSILAERRVVIDTIPPQILVFEPAEGAVLEEPETTISGSVSEPANLTIDSSPVVLAEDLTFSHGPLPLDEGENEFDLVAVDCAGNTDRVTLRVTHDPGSSGGLPPDPATVAPTLDPTVPTEFHEATRFLYDGPTPIQFEVAPAAIDPTRVAVVRGTVVARDGEPLPGVRVSVHDHGEYGHTFSREDGAFDLAVNGGARVTLEYSKAGYLPAHRPVHAPWRDFVVADDVVLLPHDENATAVSMGAAEVQVARGSVSVDEDGARQATVIFPAGTEAELVLADGSRQPVASLTVRATEYTVGPRGPETMPAPLPATSGYTYAVELSADESIAGGATMVAFTEPVYHYVENFLAFAVGSIVPAGYYDREAGVWVPSENGRVVEILEVVGGRAVLDVDGTGQPAAASELDGLGVTEGELARLGELYSPGTSLWRTPIPHFTPWDCNWPYGPPDDAEEPPEPDAEEPDPEDEESDEEQDDDEPAEDEEDSPCEEGSVIECENQVLGEEIPLVGSSQSLHYRSNRVPGRRVADVMKVRLSGRSVPASLKRIELRIDIAGRRIRRTFAPAPNQKFTFIWDRKDVYGRDLQGRHPATAHVGYVYDAVYYEPAQFPASFAAVSSRTQVTSSRTAFEVTLWRSAQKMLGASGATMVGLGGWTLSDHHLYHPSTRSRELYYGYGGSQIGDDLASLEAIWEAATDPSSSPSRPVIGPHGLVSAPDGGFYYIDLIPQGFSAPVMRVLKADADGRREGAVFVIRSLDLPQVEVGPDGDVYVATCPGFIFGEIRNLNTGESWSSFGTGCFDKFLVAPDGSFYYGRFELVHRRRDGSTSPVFSLPGFQELGFRTIDDQGRIYVSVRATNQVWRIDPDGSARIVAGTGARGFGGDGGPATQAQLDFPQELAVAPDDSLLIVDAGNRRVRRVTPSGTIHTVIGSGGSTRASGPVPPLAAGLQQPIYLAVGPDGTILVGDQPSQFGAILRLTFPLPGAAELGEISVLSDDGDGIFVFDSQGRHLRTLDALTGTSDRVFGYDEAGRLASISDAFGNVTSVERDASGSPTAIVAPFGQRTDLELDGEGFLASVTNPAGESYEFSYAGGGLLRSVTDPEGHETTYEYSPLGRLTEVRDPAGGTKTLRRWVRGPGRYRVELMTAEGRETSYSRQRGFAANHARTTSTVGGTEVTATESGDGSRRVDLPSGTSVRVVESADPRFGLQAPVLERVEVSTPSDLTRETSFQRQATLAVPGDLFSFSSLRTTWTVNGRQGSRLFDATSLTMTTTSPEGRSTQTVVDEHTRPREIRSPGVEDRHLEYDARGRLSHVSQGDGEAERTLDLDYDARGRLETLVDPLGREMRFDYDDADRVIRQTQPNGTAVELLYDAKGNLTAVVPPGRPPHLFRYTPIDAVAEYEPPELDFGRPATTYSYDRDRRLVGVKRPDGETVNLAYDAAGRPESIVHPAGVVSLGYDPDSGQLSSVSAGETLISYSYDGPLLAATTWSGAVQGTVGRGYDENFWLRSQSVNGSPVSFDYDDDGFLTRAGDLAVSRDPASGRIVGTALGSVETSASYSAFDEIESLEASTGGATRYSVAFQRDRLGRVVAKTETIDGLAQAYDYSYDPAGRLERVTRNGTTVEEYRYDDNGNRLAAVYPWGEVTATYDDQDRLLSHGVTTYTYTPVGELATRTESAATTAYEYDVFGNLRRVELPAGDTVEYVIDGQNRRVGRKVNDVLVQGFLYKDALNPVAELDGAGAVVARFVYGTRASVPDYMVKGGATYRLVADHLGTVRLVVDIGTGAIAQRLDYDTFGRTTLDTNPGFQPFGFAGGVHDQLTGFVRFGVRDYEPQAGRWTTKDPILFLGGDSNTYAYTMNDPVNATDANGLAQKCSRPLNSAVGRALGGLYPGAGSSKKLDRRNREPLHEQFWFDNGDNSGFFGPTDEKPGGVRPDPKFPREDYSCRGRQYDDDTLREAIDNVEPEDYQLLGDEQYNCQDWMSEVLSEYERLRNLKTRETGIDPETEFVWQKILGRN